MRAARPLVTLVMAISLAASACGGAATASFKLHDGTSASAAPPQVDALVVPVSPRWLGMRLLSVHLALQGAAPGAGGPTLWLNPECGGDEAGCDADGTSGAGPRVRQFTDFAQGSDALNAALGAEGRGVPAGTYRGIGLRFCWLPSGQRPVLPGVQWWVAGMPAVSSFAPPDCVVESQPFAQPLEVAAGERVEITLDYDLSATVFTGRPTYDVQCLAEASGRACFSDCADFGGGRTCAGPPAFAGRAAVVR